jgi:hypothetical protein
MRNRLLETFILRNIHHSEKALFGKAILENVLFQDANNLSSNTLKGCF